GCRLAASRRACRLTEAIRRPSQCELSLTSLARESRHRSASSRAAAQNLSTETRREAAVSELTPSVGSVLSASSAALVSSSESSVCTICVVTPWQRRTRFALALVVIAVVGVVVYTKRGREL